MQRLKLLFIIVDKNIVNKVADTVSSCGANFCHICYGKGTANNDLLNLLGIGETEKGIIFCSTTAQSVDKIYLELKMNYGFNNPGSGIAFTIPMSSVGGPATLKILQG